MKFEIKNFRTFIGREGHGFNADLYADGLKVAFVIDSANGGPFAFQWHGTDAKQRAASEKRVTEWLKANGHWEQYTGPDMWMAKLVGEHEIAKKLAGWKRTQVVFKLPTDGEEQYRTLKHMGDPRGTMMKLKAKHPDAKFF